MFESFFFGKAGVEPADSRCVSGPHAVRGEQTQRAVGAYAFHQTHAVKRKEAEERKLHSCTVCAVSHWTDDLRRVMLFVKPTKCSDPGGGGGIVAGGERQGSQLESGEIGGSAD